VIHREEWLALVSVLHALFNGIGWLSIYSLPDLGMDDHQSGHKSDFALRCLG